MNTRRTTARRLDEEIANVGVSPQGNQVPPLEEGANDDQDPVNPPPLKDGDIRDAFLQMAQDITTQAQAVTTKTQAMTQANREVVPRENQHVGTMASLLRDFTRMNPPTTMGQKLRKTPKRSLMKTYNILYAMRLTTSEKIELATYQLKDVAQTWYVQWRDNRPLRGGLVTWEIFKKAFLDRFIPREKREAKVVEFTNLRQGGMSVLE